MGRMYTLDETDILNDPRESPFLDKQSVHARVEKVYGLWMMIDLLDNIDNQKKAMSADLSQQSRNEIVVKMSSDRLLDLIENFNWTTYIQINSHSFLFSLITKFKQSFHIIKLKHEKRKNSDIFRA